MQSSLTRVLSSALVYSTRLPESVCGTVTYDTRYEVFLGSMGSVSYSASEDLEPHHFSALNGFAF